MSDDPYAALGVAKTATQDEIRKAYKKIAKESHPDLNPGDPKAADALQGGIGGARPLEGPGEAAALRRRRDRRERAGAARAPLLPRVCGRAGGDLPHHARLRGLRRVLRRLRRPLREPRPRRPGRGHPDARAGPALHARGRLPRGGARRHPADHPAGRERARREDPARASPTARRSGCAARAARASAAGRPATRSSP